jgi:hypothetical protein
MLPFHFPVILQTILTITFLGYIGYYLSIFIDFCFNEGNIFDWYYSLILKLQDNHPKLFKVLGGCIVCFSFWIHFILFMFIYISYFNFDLIWFIPYISIVEYNLIKHVSKD